MTVILANLQALKCIFLMCIFQFLVCQFQLLPLIQFKIFYLSQSGIIFFSKSICFINFKDKKEF